MGCRPAEPPREQIDGLLSFDALSEAEKITGASYKEDDATMALGLGLHMAAVKMKNAALFAAQDTHMQMTWRYFLSVATEAGFEEVYSEPFKDESRKDSQEETFTVLWHPSGLLLRAETFTWSFDKEPSTNSANLYFNWRASDQGRPWGEHNVSGGLRGEPGAYVLVGYKDVRDGLRHFITSREASGEWLSPWTERPFLWLLNYAQPKVPGYDYEALTERVIARLPEHVRSAITPTPTDANI